MVALSLESSLRSASNPRLCHKSVYKLNRSMNSLVNKTVKGLKVSPREMESVLAVVAFSFR